MEDKMARRGAVSPHKARHRPANSVLAALPDAEYQRLLAGLTPVMLKFREVLFAPGAQIRHVYFPIDSVVALVATAKGHKAVKVAFVGHEGMVGIPLALGADSSNRGALVQVAGVAMRMDAALFGAEVRRSRSLQRALFNYIHMLTCQIAQSAACKQFHAVEPRLARYLLMISESARSNELPLTQEFLAEMLGVKRTSVAMASSALRRRALIKAGHGKITVLDRTGLAATSCECYQIVKRIYAKSYAIG